MNKKILIGLAATVMTLGSAGAASAYSIDPATGAGFVGKGEVQTAMGWNNSQVQNLPVAFTQKSVTSQSFDWTCTKTQYEKDGVTIKHETIQERANVTTTDTTAVVSSVARVKNQITGFNLINFVSPTNTVVETSGPRVGSCPADQSEFDEGSIVEGDVVTVSSGLYVNNVLLPVAVPVTI